jgi:CheY-like chemotaxis protein
MPRILLIEDDLSQALVISHWLEQSFKATLIHATNGTEGLQFATFGTWDLIISDIELPELKGVDIIEDFKRNQPYTPVIMITGHPKMDYALKAIEQKADALIFKPLDKTAFCEAVEKQLRYGKDKRKKEQKIVLAIGAHPDDVEIGIGGTLLKHSTQGDEVHILTLTGGEFGGEKSLRIQESEKAAQLLKATLQMQGLRDTAVSEGAETISLIQQAIAQIQPQKRTSGDFGSRPTNSKCILLSSPFYHY